MVLRWFLGIISANIGSFATIENLPLASAHSGVVIFLLVAPIEAVGIYLITESVLSRLHAIELNVPHENRQTVGYTPYRRKIIGAVIAVSALPFFLLSYFLYATHYGMVKVDNPLATITTIAALMVIPILVMSYYLGSGITKGLNGVVSTLRQLNAGQFSVQVPVLSTDEFARAAQELNQVITRLHEQYENIQELNRNLDLKVKERTAELNQSLQKLRELSLKQDGDYFLTSLLFEPLNGDHTEPSSQIGIECFVRQKKQLKFRERDVQLGGDLAVVYPINLADGEYWAALNADCMGKSMQGAGGAITLASVFKAVVYRSSKRTQISPEHWLYECYLELQNIFTSFDGCMMASANLALIALKNPVLYWLNIEHPAPVLLREGKAKLLDAVHNIRKLGVAEAEKDFGINVFIPTSGDRVFFASDGRDDVIPIVDVPSENQVSREKMNESEHFFPSIVAQSNGTAQSIWEKLSESARLTDDFSLISIEFREVTPQVISVLPAELRRLMLDPEAAEQSLSKILQEDIISARILLRKLVNHHIRSRDFEKAIMRLEQLEHLQALSNVQLFTAAQLYTKTRRFFEATYYAERLFLRDPLHRKNNRLLRKLYEARKEVRIHDQRLWHEPIPNSNLKVG